MLEDRLMETEHLIVETATNMSREKEDIWTREKAALQVHTFMHTYMHVC